MLKLVLAAVLFAFTATAAHSGECSASLRENWSEAAGEMMEFNRQVLKARNMREGYDYKVLCAATKKIPAFFNIAKEYFPTCDPLDAARSLASIEQVYDLSVRFDRLHCAKVEAGSAHKKK